MSFEAKTREDTASISSSVEIEETCVSKNLDETVRDKTRVDMRDKKRETTRDSRGRK